MVLVDGEPIVVLWIVEVDHSRLRPADRAVGGAVLDRHAVYEQAVEGPITGFERRPLRASDLAEGVVNGFGRERGVQPSKGVAQSPLEHHLAVVGAFGGQLAGGISGPCATCQPRPHSQSRAASSTTDSVKSVTPNASSSVSARAA